ncbi:hypothetical protein ABK040_006197 [Willaertia magna]
MGSNYSTFSINVSFDNQQQVFRVSREDHFDNFVTIIKTHFRLKNLKIKLSYFNESNCSFENLEFSNNSFKKLLQNSKKENIVMQLSIDNNYLTERYEILNGKINKYGWSTLMLCYDHLRKEKVVIKKQDIELFQEFEVNLLKNVDCPFIVKAIDDFELKDLNNRRMYFYYTMPYFEQGDLFNFVNTNFTKSHIPLQLILNIIYQISKGLYYLHSKRRRLTNEIVVHRDIDLKNIFIKKFDKNTNESEIVIGDFGHARIIDNAIDLMYSVVGKRNYWSPEQIRFEEYDYKTDIWCLGLIFYQLLTKDLNLNIGLKFNENLEKTKNYIITQINLHSEINNENEESIKSLLFSMISYEKDLRFTSMEILDFLNYFPYTLQNHSKSCDMGKNRMLTEEEVEANKIMDQLLEDIDTKELILKLTNNTY